MQRWNDSSTKGGRPDKWHGICSHLQSYICTRQDCGIQCSAFRLELDGRVIVIVRVPKGHVIDKK